MTTEGAKVGLSAAEVAALIAAHAADYTKHVKIIRKTADQTVNNSTVLQDDDELFLPMAANEVWFFVLMLITNTSATALLKAAFTVPSGAGFDGIALYLDPEETSNVIFIDESTDIDTYGGEGDLVSPVVFAVMFNGTTPGDLQFKWAQMVPEESDTKVLANSCILAWKLA
jgi:hypothetical protein